MRQATAFSCVIAAMFLALVAFHPPLALAASNDDIPGVELPAPPFSDWISEYSDLDDVWAFPMERAQYVEFRITSTGNLQPGVAIFGPSAKSVWTNTPLDTGVVTVLGEQRVGWYCLKPGMYYLDVAALSGFGDYTIKATNWNYANDDDIPGTPLPSNDTTGFVYAKLDHEDVFRAEAQPGQRVTVSITTSGTLDATLRMFGQGAAGIATDAPVSTSPAVGVVRTASFITTSAGGPVYVDVHAQSGYGEYRLVTKVDYPPATVGSAVAPTKVRRNKSFVVRGTLMPKHAAGSYPVRIYKWKKTSSGAWKSAGYVRARVADYATYSKYSVSLKLKTKGKWRLRAYAPADATHSAAWSSKFTYVTVK